MAFVLRGCQPPESCSIHEVLIMQHLMGSCLDDLPQDCPDPIGLVGQVDTVGGCDPAAGAGMVLIAAQNVATSVTG